MVENEGIFLTSLSRLFSLHEPLRSLRVLLSAERSKLTALTNAGDTRYSANQAVVYLRGCLRAIYFLLKRAGPLV